MEKKPWEKQELYETKHPIVKGAYNPSAVRTVESIDEYVLPIMPYLVEVGTVPAKGEPEDRLRQLFRTDTKGVKERLTACEKELMKEFDGKLSSLKEITLGIDNFAHSFHVQFATEEPLTEQDYGTIRTTLTDTEKLDFLNASDIGFNRHKECGPVVMEPYTWKHFGWQNIMDPWAIQLNGDDEKDHFREAEIEMNTGRLQYRIDISKDGIEFPRFADINADNNVISNKFCETLAEYGVERVSAMSYGTDCSSRVQDVAMVRFTIPYDNKVVDPHEIAAKLHEAMNELKEERPEVLQDSEEAFSNAVAALSDPSEMKL